MGSRTVATPANVASRPLAKWGILGIVVVALAAGAVVLGLRPSATEADRFSVGVWEYFIRDADPAGAERKLADTEAAGFEAAITNSFWEPGQREPSPQEIAELQNAAEAAEEAGVTPLLIVQNVGSRTTPRTPEQRREFATNAASHARQLPAYRP